MAWYPDWVIALDEVSKNVEGARVNQRNALDIIREIKRMQAEIAELKARPRGVQIGDGNTQHVTF